MQEAAEMLKRKIGELQTEIDEAQRELARTDRSRRTDWHARLSAAVREAREWMETDEPRADDDDGATAAARTAEGHVHEIRMRRNEP